MGLFDFLKGKPEPEPDVEGDEQVVKTRDKTEWGYTPDVDELFRAALAHRDEHGILPMMEDAKQEERRVVTLVLVDCQQDFSMPSGAMYPGDEALGVTERICDLIHNNLGDISRVIPTLTNHFPFQVFFPSFWLDAEDKHPDPGTEITPQDIEDGKFKPTEAIAEWLCKGDAEWLTNQCNHYVEALAEKDRKLLLKVPHCMHGTQGYTLNGAIDEARLFHSYARCYQAECEVNGSHPLTQNESFFGPFVISRYDDPNEISWKNVPVLRNLLRGDLLVFAGHHGVYEAVTDLKALMSAPDKKPDGIDPEMWEQIKTQGKADLESIRVVVDCTIDRPGRKMPCKVVKSTTPVSKW